jgi:membrane-bound lytic murein transglycosylase D
MTTSTPALSNGTLPSNSVRTPGNQSSEKTSSEDIISNSIIVNQVIVSNETTLPETNPVENLFTSLDTIRESSSIASANAQPLPVEEQLASRPSLDSTPVSLGVEVTAAPNNIETEGILDTDPANYYVDINGNIEAQASETIGRLANWLDIRAWDIRRLNNMNYRDQIFIGKKILLDFNRISIADFEISRRDYHANLQRDFFDSHQIKGSEEYEIKINDNIDRLAQNTYSAPLWLVRQYNPDFDFNRIPIQKLKQPFPIHLPDQFS